MSKPKLIELHEDYLSQLMKAEMKSIFSINKSLRLNDRTRNRRNVHCCRVIMIYIVMSISVFKIKQLIKS